MVTLEEFSFVASHCVGITERYCGSAGWRSGSCLQLTDEYIKDGYNTKVPGKLLPSYVFDLSGGNLCLDFANTVSHRDLPERTAEHLNSVKDLVAFAQQSKLISPKQAAEIFVFAQQNTQAAERLFQRALILREHIFRVFAAVSQGGTVADDDIQAISAAASEGMQHRALVAADGSYEWQWSPGGPSMLEQILWQIAQSAADLLTSDQLKLVRFCEASDCQWLFLDNSRNRSRRWCDMTICGNREKARRHYQRTHG